MTQTRLAIVGFGRLGQACARAIALDERLVLTGIVRIAGHERLVFCAVVLRNALLRCGAALNLQYFAR